MNRLSTSAFSSTLKKPEPWTFLAPVHTLYKYYIFVVLLSPSYPHHCSSSSLNQDTAAWGTFYKYRLTGYMAFRGLCEFTGLAPSKGLCCCWSHEGWSTRSPLPDFISLRWEPLNGPICPSACQEAEEVLDWMGSNQVTWFKGCN